MPETQVAVNATRIADGLIQQAAEIRAYQDFCNDMSMAAHVFMHLRDTPEDEDLVVRLTHGRGFRPQLFAAMQAAGSAQLNAAQLRRIYS